MAISREEVMTLWDGVKANSKSLEECGGPHEFIGDEDEVQAEYVDGKLYRRYVCQKCKGKVTSHEKRWYEVGLNHGRNCK